MRTVLTSLGVAVLTAALVTLPATPPSQAASSDGAGVVHPEWGSIAGQGGVLKKGCRTYRYSYDIRPPQGDWALEVFVSGPRLESLAAGAYMGGYDPERNVGTYKICQVTTRPGRFTIRAKLSVQDGVSDYVEGWLPPDQFRLRARRR